MLSLLAFAVRSLRNRDTMTLNFFIMKPDQERKIKNVLFLWLVSVLSTLFSFRLEYQSYSVPYRVDVFGFSLRGTHVSSEASQNNHLLSATTTQAKSVFLIVQLSSSSLFYRKL